MKKMLMALLVAVLWVIDAAPGFAQTPVYDATQRFLMALEEQALPCESPVLDETGGEHVLVEYGEYIFDVCFRADEDMAEIHVQPVITFDAADALPVLREINGLNGAYKYVRFYVGEDSTVVCAMNLILHDGGDAGEITLQGMARMDAILQAVLPQLAAYGK